MSDNLKKPLIIFGNSIIAKLALYYFNRDSGFNIVALTVDEKYINGAQYLGYPIFPFEKIQDIYSPKDFEIFIAIGPNEMNSIREKKLHESLKKGYQVASYISPYSICHSLPGVNSFIADGVIINPFVKLGNNNFFWENSLISNESIIDDNCYFAPRSVVSSYCHVKSNSIVGTNSVLKAHIIIEYKTLVGAQCYISKNTTQFSVYGEKNSEFLGSMSEKINISL
jgi:acetyltransferase-like isoleucine patch superfamily enzyme